MPLSRSWIASANRADCPFPLNNLPCGVFSVNGDAPRCGVAIGDAILDMAALQEAGMAGPDLPAGLFAQGCWRPFLRLGPPAWVALRARLTGLLAEGADLQTVITPCLVPMEAADLHLPFTVTEYTDFYASRHHATNVGTLFRGAETALPPNWLHMPIGYNGRASTVVVSGTPVIRPNGQTRAPDATAPVFGPCQKLDFELELGAVVGGANAMGTPVSVAEADEMIFGYVLLNDWSARDIQAWEYQPLGPFQAKAFATTISPWIVPAAALAPFRTAGPDREVPLLPYLAEPGPMLFDIDLAVSLRPGDGAGDTTIARTSAAELYYSSAQQLAHHASSGCAMRAGDLLGSGTVSGPGREACGSLLEITRNGAEPLDLPTGQSRRFLEDGDTVTLHGTARGDGYTIGFGPCSGTILPASKGPPR